MFQHSGKARLLPTTQGLEGAGQGLSQEGHWPLQSPDQNLVTPYEKLKFLPKATTYLKPGLTFDQLDELRGSTAKALHPAQSSEARSLSIDIAGAVRQPVSSDDETAALDSG
jgi:hypothetical protein